MTLTKLISEYRVALAALMVMVALIAVSPNVYLGGEKIIEPSNAGSLLEPMDRSRYVEISEALNRPLFSEDRKPYSPPEAAIEPAEVIEDIAVPFTLAGIVSGGDEALWVYIVVTETGESQRVAVGEDVLGWTIVSVEGGQVTVSDGMNSRILLGQDSNSGIRENNGSRARGRSNN